jgi:hypothetical protein
MQIFDHEPADWSALQDMVGRLFEELGCETAVGMRVENVRGTKEIDVYVRDVAIAPPSTYLVECKLWKRAVPQEVVHAFRTVMADAGAHRGFIVSSQGFQEGAFEAAANTNIDLVTFRELQSIFADRWRISMGERFLPLGDQLFPYWDFPGRMPRFKWGKKHVERHQQLMDAYEPIRRLGPFLRMQRFLWELPLSLPAVNERGEIGGSMITLGSYRQLYDFIERNKELALYHFQVLHGEIPAGSIEGEYNPMA